MEKIVRNAVFLLGFFLSCASFAEVEETYTYGTKTSTGPLSFGDWYKEWLLLGGAGAHAQVAGSEYSNYRADIEKKKYCKANNYPTNVSFCAGYKEAERVKKVQACKMESVGITELCNKAATSIHTRNSKWCSGAKWIGGAFGVLGGWAYSEGEGAGAVLLAGAGMAIYQSGDDCQTDMDRVLDASRGICGTEQTKRDLGCDAIK